MEKKLIKTVCTLFCLLLSVSLFAQDKEKDLAKYAGEWTFNVADAPYGYENGTAKFQITEGKLTGEFKLSGSSMKVNSFKEENDGYSCVVYVDGYPVNVKIFYKNDKLTGIADADMPFSINFTRIKK